MVEAFKKLLISTPIFSPSRSPARSTDKLTALYFSLNGSSVIVHPSSCRSQSAVLLSIGALPERKSLLVRQEVAEFVLQAVALRMFLTQVLIAGIVTHYSYIAAKIPDRLLNRTTLQIAQPREHLHNYLGMNIFRVLTTNCSRRIVIWSVKPGSDNATNDWLGVI